MKFWKSLLKGVSTLTLWPFELEIAMTKEKKNLTHETKRTLREGISGHWHYHYSTKDGKAALCGADTMYSNAPENTWGFVGHLNERYCSKCAGILAEGRIL